MIIQETRQTIEALEVRWERELEQRYARRNKIRFIDELLNDFEELNLAEEPEVPATLKSQVGTLVKQEAHPLKLRDFQQVSVGEWMEALYDIQDTLMFTPEAERY
jgi:hypothetical protein